MSEQVKRKPDWTLCVKEREAWMEVGAAWNTERGNIFIRFKTPVEAGESVMAFPFREKAPSRYAARVWKRPVEAPKSAPPPQKLPQAAEQEEFKQDLAAEQGDGPPWL